VLKHLKPHEIASTTKMPVVDPQLATIIRNNAETVMASPENPHATCPMHREVIASGKARPSATCVPIVHHMTPASHLWPWIVQILASTALPKIESIFPEDTMSINCADRSRRLLAARTRDRPSVSSVAASVSQKHTCMASMLKHLKSY
jgi:hypothetical protein